MAPGGLADRPPVGTRLASPGSVYDKLDLAVVETARNVIRPVPDL
jgi:hypothetical protein